MSLLLNYNDYRSGSLELSSTPNDTPEGSTPTTSTEAVSCWERFKLQKGPWIGYFHKNKIRFILSGLFLLIQLSLLTCRLVLHFLYYRLVFSIFSTVSGVISFTIIWGRWKTAGQTKPSWLQRLLLQREPWTLHLKNYALECAMASVLFAVFLTLAAFRLFTTVDDPPTFTIAASFSYVLSFAFLWLLIPEAPPFLATPDGLPVFKAVLIKSDRQSFKNV